MYPAFRKTYILRGLILEKNKEFEFFEEIFKGSEILMVILRTIFFSGPKYQKTADLEKVILTRKKRQQKILA